jgi:membrane associated rhomboid family serine protease
MIIPLGHEQTSVRRLPWVTFAIMAICVVVFVLMAPGEHHNQMESFFRLHQALGYFTQHPYLEIDPRFQRIFASDFGVEEAEALTEYMRQVGPQPPEDPDVLDREQRRFNTMVDGYHRCLQRSMLSRFGLVPAELKAANLFTYPFLHSGWLHLLFNLLMLFVVAPFVEDVWGRPLFTGFYLAAGAVAGVMFAVRYPELELPLVGASGAVAGVMGAFLVRYLRSRIRFVLWIAVPIGPLQAPAWVLFPMWFAIQLASAHFMDAGLPEGATGGVAFWAHVWGFAFGVVFAWAMAHFRIEERYLHPAIESKVTMLDNVAVETALARAGKGDLDWALASLEREIAADPDNVDAAMALWNLAVTRGQAHRGVEPILRAITGAVRTGDQGFVISHWEEVLIHDPEAEVDPLLAVRIAEILDDAQRVMSAVETLELALRRTDDSTPGAVLLRMARLGLAIEVPSAEAMVRAALANPEVPGDARPELEVALWGIDKRRLVPSTATVTDERVRPELPPGADKMAGIQVTTVVPFAIKGHELTVDCSGHFQSIDLRSVQAVAAALLARHGRKPVALIDLLFEQPGQCNGKLPATRIFSDSFDPRTMVGGEDRMVSFWTFVTRVIDTSSAIPMPSQEAARGRPPQSFPSLEHYQRKVLGVTD